MTFMDSVKKRIRDRRKRVHKMCRKIMTDKASLRMCVKKLGVS